MPFPENCIRGIPNKTFLYDDETVAAHLFDFKQRDARDDGLTEQSINWEDDTQAVEFTLSQTKEDGDRQFKAGVAIVPRSEIDRINKLPGIGGDLSYERQPLAGNPYHGNLLLPTDTSKKKMRMIAGSLALAVSTIMSQGRDESS
jgi:hypothetical protein